MAASIRDAKSIKANCEIVFSKNILSLKLPKIKPITPFEKAFAPNKLLDKQSWISPNVNPDIAPLSSPKLALIKIVSIKTISGLTPRIVKLCRRVVWNTNNRIIKKIFNTTFISAQRLLQEMKF